MDTIAIKASPPEAPARKIITTGLLVLSLVAIALPFVYAHFAIKPENEMVNILYMVFFAYLLPICVVLGSVLATLAGIFSKSSVRRTLAFALALLELLAITVVPLLIALFKYGVRVRLGP